MKRFLFFIVTVTCLYSCDNHGNKEMNCSADELFAQQDSVLAHSDEYSDTIVIKYAKGLKVDYQSDGVHLYISNPDPNAKIYDFTDAGDGLSEADAKTVDDLVRESFYCYFDYYENYDGRKAIDLDGDGNISNIEMNICAYFTSGAEFRGLMIDQIN